MDKHRRIRITMKGAGLSYQKDIDESTAGQIMALCLSSRETAIGSEKGIAKFPRAVHSSQLESAAEFLNRHAPKRNPDKILTLAGFLKDSNNKTSFQGGEIKSLFRDAGELMPANFTRDFKWVVNSGWIAPDPSKKGSYYITNTGLKVLEGGFPDEFVKKTKFKVGGRRRRSVVSRKHG